MHAKLSSNIWNIIKIFSTRLIEVYMDLPAWWKRCSLLLLPSSPSPSPPHSASSAHIQYLLIKTWNRGCDTLRNAYINIFGVLAVQKFHLWCVLFFFQLQLSLNDTWCFILHIMRVIWHSKYGHYIFRLTTFYFNSNPCNTWESR